MAGQSSARGAICVLIHLANARVRFHLADIHQVTSKLPIFVLIALSTAVAAFGAEDRFEKDIRPVLESQCVKCHGPEKQKGKFRIDTLTADFSDREIAGAWLEVRDMINLGEMPPEDEKPLGIDQIAAISSWIADEQRREQRKALSSGGRVLLRRLNRQEYTHTVADLLHMVFPPGDSPMDFLPPDGTAEGFDKVSAALLVDPSLMKLYYDVARQIADRALVEGPPEFPTAKMRLEFEEIEHSRAIGYQTEGLNLRPAEGGLLMFDGGTRSFGLLRYPGQKNNNIAPVSGSYRFTVRAGAERGNADENPRLELRHKHPSADMQLVAEFEVDAPLDAPKEYSVVVPRDEQGGEIGVQIVPGISRYMGQRPGEEFLKRISETGKQKNYAEVLRLTGRKILEGAGGGRSTPDPEKLDTSHFSRVFIDYLEVEGPLYNQWPPRSHETLFFKGETGGEDLAYAREMFARFLPQAWRRPVLPEEIERIVRIVAMDLENGKPFVEAVRVGLTATLTSPKFLYVFEPGDDEAPRRLNDYELASRLSYALWSSMPDEALFRLAASGKLSDPATLEAQVDRMIADPKISRFVDGFARQWLRAESFLAFTPDQYVYRDYDPKLGELAVREALEFFATILREDLSALNFIDSDFVIVNEALAEHYGLPGVEGEEFRRVALAADSKRGGLLGMLGVHLAGSDGLRTKPVSRAVYVREVLFNDPPDPPPPNAGEIEPNIKGEKLTVRERLLQHQEVESCASCHRRLDPYGLALENFNVIGLWREVQDGESFRTRDQLPIVVEGQLPNGRKFASFEEFRALLREQEDRFRRGLAEKLWIYALGRPIEPSDDSAIQAATRRMKENGDTLRALVKGLVTSPQFLEK